MSDNTSSESSANSARESLTVGPGRSSIDPEEFQRFLEHATELGNGEPQSLKSWLELAEAWQITRALRLCRGNRSAAARALGIGRRTLYAKMDKLRITASWGV
jgi:DNA-binding NtrC family response regulator